MRAIPICVLLCSTLLAAFAPTPSACAQSGSVIAEIHVTGSHRYGERQVADTAGLKPGAPAGRDQLQQAADRLAQLGVFSTVNYRFTPKGDRIDVFFEVQDAPLVPVLFDNFPWFSDEELAAAMRQAVPLFDGAAPLDGTLLDEMTAALSRLLAMHNLKTNVEHTLVAQPFSDGMMIEFRQTDLPLTTASLAFNDPQAQASEKLRDRTPDLVGKPFSRFALELFENEQVRPIYLSTGHLRAKFAAPVVHFGDAASGAPSELQVAVAIDPGAVYRVSGFSYSGQNVLNASWLAGSVSSRVGDVADGMRLATDWQRLESEYTHRGYLDVKVDPQPQFDDTNAKVDYHIVVTEGPVYRMGNLVITGLSIDAERTLRKVWQLAEGQVFDNTYYEQMLRKLERPSTLIFGDRPIHYDQFGHFLRPDAEKHTVDVLLDFQ